MGKCLQSPMLHLTTEKKRLEGSKPARYTGLSGTVAQPVIPKTGEAKGAELPTLKPAWPTLGVPRSHELRLQSETLPLKGRWAHSDFRKPAHTYLERFVSTVCQHVPLQPTLTCWRGVIHFTTFPQANEHLFKGEQWSLISIRLSSFIISNAMKINW